MIPKKNSLRISRHIKRAFDKGINYRGDVFSARAFFTNNLNAPTHLAVIAGKKLARGAVERNLIRRHVKAAFRENFDNLAGWDIAVLPNNRIKTEKFEIIVSEAKKCSDFLQSKSSFFIRKR